MPRSAEGALAPTIGELRLTDLPEVIEIERASFQLPWSESAFRALMRRDDTTLFAARRQGRVVGYAVVWFAAEEGELGDIAVRPQARRAGIGRRLLEAVQRESRRRGARRVFLQVRESNEAARRLYETSNFRESGRRSGYYRFPPEDAVIMLWEDEESPVD